MSWEVREATPSERERLRVTEDRLFGPDATLRADWLLDANPQGKAAVLVAVTPEGELAGTRSLLPWTLYADGEPVKVGQYARTWTDPRFRQQGVSVAVGQGLNRASGELGYPMVFLFPSVRSIPGHRIIGNQVDTLLARAQGVAGLGWRGGPTWVNPLLRWGRRAAGWRAARGAERWEPAPHLAADADRVWPQLVRRSGVHGPRDGAFVAWRYDPRTGREYRSWRYPAGAREPRFLAVSHLRNQRVKIVDFWGPGSPDEQAGALHALTELLVAGGGDLVEWCPSRFGSGPSLARQAGFLIRGDGVPLARWFNRDRSELGPLGALEGWQLTEGDSDYA